MRDRRFSQDVLAVFVLFVLIVLSSLFPAGSANAQSQLPGLPPAPGAVVLQNLPALGGILPEKKPSTPAGEFSNLPPVRPASFEWIFMSDAALRSA